MKSEIYMLCMESMKQLDAMQHSSLKVIAKRKIKSVLGRNVMPKDPVFWPAGAILLGLTEAVIAGDNKESGEEAKVLEYINKYIGNWLNSRPSESVKNTDDALAGYAMLKLYEYTEDELYKAAAEKIAAFILNASVDNAGSIIYHPERGNSYIFADGAGMTAAFLAKYGEMFGNEKALNKAALQINNFFNYGMDNGTGLPYHGYEYELKEKKGLVGWGRAIGWLMLGASEVFLNTTDDLLQEKYSLLLQYICDLQRDDGSFSWLPEAVEAHADTSATAMIAYAAALLKDSPRLSEELRQSLTLLSEDAVLYVNSQIKDGRVGNALGECVDFAMHPQKYGVYPWGQGMALALIAINEKKH
ncbi:MAG: glycoside hydrolase family 88 protein [Butyrivibrio sp.]|nr:glycoside hydrolase family 88 protein [Butyrivibrio sp.]